MGKATEQNNKVPPSRGYLVLDPKKCTACFSCMLACSLVHEGRSSFSLSRIQVVDDAFGSFPADVEVAICHQCELPECYLACPSKDEAFQIDRETGLRYINAESCSGCGLCMKACAFSPSRITLDPDKKVAIKCDLCRSTPYWRNEGKQACIEVCPVKAIKFTTTKPRGYEGYRINLRGEGWAQLGLPTD